MAARPSGDILSGWRRSRPSRPVARQLLSEELFIRCCRWSFPSTRMRRTCRASCASSSGFRARLNNDLEVIFVVDGSPTTSLRFLQRTSARLARPNAAHRAQPEFRVVRGRGWRASEHADGEYMAVIAADLQEPPELVLEFHRILTAGEADVVFGASHRAGGPVVVADAVGGFWHLYRRFVVRTCHAAASTCSAAHGRFAISCSTLKEAHTNLVALVFWLGFRRSVRALRTPCAPARGGAHGRSAASCAMPGQRLQLHRSPDQRAPAPRRASERHLR